jgi:signal transduction histidine kinase
VQLESALTNLVENGLTHGGATVALRGWTEGGYTGWEVSDAGPGISAANLSRVFDRFFTTRRSEGGSGLGLSLVRAVVESHGGDVRVTSDAEGTVFCVSLPSDEQA